MSRTAIRRVGLAVVGMVFVIGSVSARALDGFVITVQWKIASGASPDHLPDAVGAPAAGNLVRYDLKDDRVVRTRTVYDKGDASRAVIGPRGDRVAFVRKDGTICVTAAGGGAVTELVKAGTAVDVQWPAGEGGRWIYYLGRDPRGQARLLRRVSVADGKSEHVVAFDATPSAFAVSQDVTRTSGHLVARLDAWPGVVGYDLTLGTGDLYQRLLDEGASGPTVAPDGALFADVNADRTALRVADWNGRPRKVIRTAQPAADAFASPRWAANAGEWVVAAVGRRNPDQPRFVTSLDAVVYDWARGRPVRITNNEAGTFDQPQGLWVAGGTDFGLGTFEGEAPYRVALAPDGSRDEWEWDYGDGKTERSATGLHTYAEAGTFNVKARRGDVTMAGTVNVLDRAAPHVVSAHMLDERRLLVEFDEAVLTDADTEVTASAGGDVTRWALDANRRLMTVDLANEPVGAVELSLTGFHDVAQTPNPLADGKVSVGRLDWPSRRERLAFLWESAGAANVTFDPASNGSVTHRVLRDGQAKFDRHGAMQLNGGRFRATADATEAIAGATGEAFTLELTLRPRELSQGGGPAAPVVSLGDGSAEPSFLLAQDGNRLVARFATLDGGQKLQSPILPVATLPDAGPHHVVLSYAPGRLACYLDGQTVSEPQAIRGAPALAGTLTFGPGWVGTIEGVALYGRALEAQEVQRDFAAYRKRLDERPKVPVLEAEAKLVATSTVPTFASVAPYREALVVYEYEITKLVNGAHEGKKLRVAHFGLVNAQPTEIAKAQVGAARHLRLEKYTDRPDLKGTLLSDTLPEDFEAVLYVEAE